MKNDRHDPDSRKDWLGRLAIPISLLFWAVVIVGTLRMVGLF
jgi:hypothetical protein